MRGDGVRKRTDRRPKPTKATHTVRGAYSEVGFRGDRFYADRTELTVEQTKELEAMLRDICGDAVLPIKGYKHL